MPTEKEWKRKRADKPCTVLAGSIQKGGVGKTTTVCLLGWLLAKSGYKVLVVDFDSQGNATEFLTLESPYAFDGHTAFEGVVAGDISDSIYEINDNLYLVPATDHLVRLVSKLYSKEWAGKNRSSALKEALAPVREMFDFVLIDLPPNMGELTVNGLVASDYVIPIFQTEKFCFNALDRYIELTQEVQRLANPKLKILGILPTMMEKRVYDMGVLEAAKTLYGPILFDTIIKRAARIKEFTIDGIQEEKSRDKDALKLHRSFMKEMIDRVDKTLGTTPEQIQLRADKTESRASRRRPGA